MIGLELILAATRGALVGGPPPALNAVRTDSRSVASGDVFVALKGERFDGHEFLAEAHARGAALAIVSRDVPGTAMPLVRVDDTLRALGDLARARRAEFRGPVIAVTGSNGKTTTKDMCAAILAAMGPVLATSGNRNNEIGLPLTLLDLEERHRFAVVEAAMRGPGEIAYLSAIARPDVGVITNVAPAHLGRLGSLERIAEAKGELWTALAPGGRAVYPSDEPLLAAQAARLDPGALLRFGQGADDAARIERCEPKGEASDVVLRIGGEQVAFSLPLPGIHNVRNAAAAALAAWAVGATPAAIAAGLAHVRLTEHRSRTERVGGRLIYDDCYNANPHSMDAALRAATVLAGGGRVIAILGDMKELGDEGPALHAEVGKLAAAAGVAVVIGVGPLSAETARAARSSGVPTSHHVQDADEAAAKVAAEARAGDVILVKGSRAMALERVVERLHAAWAASPEREAT